ncbi:MAG: hypothetical protein ABIQ93_16555 [Saprospiraceae bacterium]
MRQLSTGLALFLFPFALLAQGYADCGTAMSICKKQKYSIARVGGEGSDRSEADFTACFMNGENYGQAEENSTWIKFEVDKAGSLAFSIRPHNLDDDIDFVVFKLPPTGDCRYKQIVRCMAAGDSRYNATISPCMGATGLRDGEKDTSEDAGCGDEGDNTWLAPLRVMAGEKYIVLVSNVSEPGPGFDITFTGSCKLPCDDEPDKIVQAPPKKEPAKKPTPAPPKPAEKPTVVPDTPPVVAEKPAEKPTHPAVIEGREVEVHETVQVKNREIRVKIWDSQLEDGDIVSIFIDEKRVIDHITLTKKPREYKITLPPGKKEYYLTVYADSFGQSEPNTARVLINDGVQEQTIDLVSGRKKQESVKLVAD